MERKRDDLKQKLREFVAAQGRDDIGVTDVVEEDGQVRFTLNRGQINHVDTLPLTVFQNPEEAKRSLSGVLMKISKQIEQKHIEKAP